MMAGGISKCCTPARENMEERLKDQKNNLSTNRNRWANRDKVKLDWLQQAAKVKMKLVVASSLTGNTTEWSKPEISVWISFTVAVSQVQVGPYVDKPTWYHFYSQCLTHVGWQDGFARIMWPKHVQNRRKALNRICQLPLQLQQTF